MRIGLISDTHGFIDSNAKNALARVEHILHAGDIGHTRIIDELLSLAPVTAVLGNNDAGLPYPETAVVELGGQTILVHHIVLPERASKSIGPRFDQAKPHIVVFGHTHEMYQGIHEGTLFINPGFAGAYRGTVRSVAILELNARKPLVHFSRW